MVSPGLSHKVNPAFRDAERFDPLRYAEGREEDRAHAFNLIGFGGGRHKCAGMSFANNEMALIAALLLQRMDLELMTMDPGTEYGMGAPRPMATRLRYRRIST
jgi:sterol 14-demethylase